MQLLCVFICWRQDFTVAQINLEFSLCSWEWSWTHHLPGSNSRVLRLGTSFFLNWKSQFHSTEVTFHPVLLVCCFFKGLKFLTIGNVHVSQHYMREKMAPSHTILKCLLSLFLELKFHPIFHQWGLGFIFKRFRILKINSRDNRETQSWKNYSENDQIIPVYF